ncbi:MAG: ribosome silencing factor [Planctomycetota bacterium]|jgi:ribosome-associated protein
MSGRETLSSQALLERAVALCVEKRAENLVALDVRDLVQYMDYLLIVSGRSERQNRAIAENVVRGSKRLGVVPLSKAGVEAGSWICLDLVDVVVHVFTPEVREHYDLELLWADAPRVDLSDISVPAAPEEDVPFGLPADEPGDDG